MRAFSQVCWKGSEYKSRWVSQSRLRHFVAHSPTTRLSITPSQCEFNLCTAKKLGASLILLPSSCVFEQTVRCIYNLDVSATKANANYFNFSKTLFGIEIEVLNCILINWKLKGCTLVDFKKGPTLNTQTDSIPAIMYLLCFSIYSNAVSHFNFYNVTKLVMICIW